MKKWERYIVALVILAGVLAVSQVSTVTTYASWPTNYVGGRLLLSLDSYLLGQDTGTGRQYFGPLYHLTPPPALDTWTQINMGSSGLTEAYGGITLTPQVGSSQFRVLVRAQPATPYTITAHVASVLFQGWGGASNIAGIGFRESATGKVLYWGCVSSSGYTNSGWALWAGHPQDVWYGLPGDCSKMKLRLTHSGSALGLWYSPDGANWLQAISRTLTNDFTTAPDQVLFFVMQSTAQSAVNNAFSVQSAATLQSWSVE